MTQQCHPEDFDVSSEDVRIPSNIKYQNANLKSQNYISKYKMDKSSVVVMDGSGSLHFVADFFSGDKIF